MLVSGPNVRIGKVVWEAAFKGLVDESRHAIEGVIRVMMARVGTYGGQSGQPARRNISHEGDIEQFAEWLGIEYVPGWEMENKIVRELRRRIARKIRS